MLQIWVTNLPLALLFIEEPICDVTYAVHEHSFRYQDTRALLVHLVKEFEHLTVRLDPQDVFLFFFG